MPEWGRLTWVKGMGLNMPASITPVSPCWQGRQITWTNHVPIGEPALNGFPVKAFESLVTLWKQLKFMLRWMQVEKSQVGQGSGKQSWYFNNIGGRGDMNSPILSLHMSPPWWAIRYEQGTWSLSRYSFCWTTISLPPKLGVNIIELFYTKLNDWSV